MRDFNFFSDYIFIKSSFRIKKLIIPGIYLIVILVVVGTFFIMHHTERKLQDEYDANQRIIESAEFIQVSEDVITLREEMALFRQISEEVVLFDLVMQFDYPVTDDLISKILEATPRNVVFRTYGINNRVITITAETTDYSYIAEIENNLRDFFIFANIFVSLIDREEDRFTFTIELDLGGELND